MTDITGLPAARKVMVRMLDTLVAAAEAAAEGEPGHGVQIFIDRPFDEPFQEEELEAGAVNIRCVDTARNQRSLNEIIHRAAYEFDIGSAEGSVNSIGHRQAVIEAWLNDVLQSDHTLGGLVSDISTPSMTGDEQAGLEAGIILSAVEVLYLTSRTDFFTIIGPGGLVA